MPSALRRQFDVEPAKPSTIAVAKPARELQINVTLQKMAAVAQASPLKIMREYCSLAFGPGQVSFKDYTRLRLFDDAFYPEKRAVVGQRKNSDIDLTINYRHDWIGLFSNKVASASYLAAHGFPTIPVQGIYAANIASKSPSIARDRDALKEFLCRVANYPIFGKPTEGIQSLGSLGIRRYIPTSDCLETMGGDEIPLKDYLSDIVEHYPQGYLFQNFLSPHAAVHAMCGNRLATVRVVTLARDGQPDILRACWKIPAGGNLADNYWRPGNLLAQVDVSTGQILRVLSGTGLELTGHTVHPDTNTPLIGMVVPCWADLTRTAVEAARLMHQMPLIGFDMAISEAGPVIVEMNHNPDFFLNQLADGRGMLDEELLNVIAAQKRKASERSKEIKREARQL
jgi:hypothetical protein